MAIEFNCPYCTATIRVPDEYAGKQGKCPKCDTIMIVPEPRLSPERPPASSDAAETSPVPSSSAPPTIVAETGLRSTRPAPPPISNETEDDSTPNSNDAPTRADAIDFSVLPGQSISKKLKQRRRGRKSQQILAWAIPVVCLAMFVGVIGLVTVLQTPELKGTLIGVRSATLEIPAATVSLAGSGLSREEKTGAIQAFERSAESFVSSQVACRILATDGVLKADVRPAEGFAWYMMNPNTVSPLRDWIRDNTERLNLMRIRQLDQAVGELCRQKLRKAEGESVKFNADVYRDDIGVNSHVNAFGFAVEAIGANTRSLCFHEDSNGTLYFALPKTVSSFVVRGRSVEDRLLFPGEYTVTVDSDANLKEEEDSSPIDGSSTDPDENPEDRPAEVPPETNDMNPSSNEMPDSEVRNEQGSQTPMAATVRQTGCRSATRQSELHLEAVAPQPSNSDDAPAA